MCLKQTNNFSSIVEVASQACQRCRKFTELGEVFSLSIFLLRQDKIVIGFVLRTHDRKIKRMS